MILRNTNLFFKLYKENDIPPCISSLAILDKTYHTKESSASCNIYSINFIPSYVGLRVNKDFLKLPTIKQSNLGYALVLKDFKTKDEYISEELGRKAKNIRRLSRKLEQCFSINYHTYYGEIEMENFKFLMRRLKEMIEIRFQQRGQTNLRLAEWKNIEDETYSQILEKKASLFVIYNDNEPIEISLSYHFNDLQFSAISSYDIAYEKFSLGSIHFYQIIDWCIEQKVKILEMGFGDLHYKRLWCNLIYNYTHEILYKKGNGIAPLKSRLNWLFVFMRELLKKSFLLKLKINLTSLANGRKKAAEEESNIFSSINIRPPNDLVNYSKIYFDNASFPSTFKKVIYEFQFKYNCHTQKLNIYQHKINTKTYLLNFKSNYTEVIVI